MDRKTIGDTASKAKPNLKPIASNGGVMNLTALTAPTALGGFSSGQPQPRAHTGQASSSIALNHGNIVPTMQHATAGYRMQSMGHPNMRQNFHGRFPNARVQQIFQHYPITNNRFIQHAGLLDQTAPNSQVGIPNNAAARKRLHHQMSGNAHSTAVASAMAQRAQLAQLSQPAQPATPQMTMAETMKVYKEREKQDDINFNDDIQSFEDVHRFSEAEKRLSLVPTPKLARDYPTDTAQQQALANDLYNSLDYWSTPNVAGSKMAINRIKSKSKFSIKLVAWKLLVF